MKQFGWQGDYFHWRTYRFTREPGGDDACIAFPPNERGGGTTSALLRAPTMTALRANIRQHRLRWGW